MKKTPAFIFVGGCLLVLLFWFIVWKSNLGFCATDLGSQGQFGDKFGALNCLFTGLALAGLVASFWHERVAAAERDNEQRAVLTAMRRQSREVARSARVSALGAKLYQLEMHRATNMTARHSGMNMGMESREAAWNVMSAEILAARAELDAAAGEVIQD